MVFYTEYYSAIKKINESLVGKWIHFETLTLIEINQARKLVTYGFSYMRTPKKQNKRQQEINRETSFANGKETMRWREEEGKE